VCCVVVLSAVVRAQIDVCFDDINCPQPSNVADPENCTTYFLCDGASLFSRTCPVGEFFHQNVYRCTATARSCAIPCRDNQMAYKNSIVTTTSSRPDTTSETSAVTTSQTTAQSTPSPSHATSRATSTGDKLSSIFITTSSDGRRSSKVTTDRHVTSVFVSFSPAVSMTTAADVNSSPVAATDAVSMVTTTPIVSASRSTMLSDVGTETSLAADNVTSTAADIKASEVIDRNFSEVTQQPPSWRSESFPMTTAALTTRESLTTAGKRITSDRY